ncbi:MAG: cell division protein SepF [Schwartzia sp.]|nr:cell division protein SepF [Schwartzia sp. (in: firmicutes)]
MGIIDKFKTNLMGKQEEEPQDDMEREEERAEEEQEKVVNINRFAAKAAPRMDNVVDIRSAGQAHASLKVLVIEPQSFDDVQQIADSLKEKKPVVVNFERTDAEDAKRIIDFLSGTVYSLKGDIKKVGHNVFLCAPNNVNVSFTKDHATGNLDFSWIKKE